MIRHITASYSMAETAATGGQRLNNTFTLTLKACPTLCCYLWARQTLCHSVALCGAAPQRRPVPQPVGTPMQPEATTARFFALTCSQRTPLAGWGQATT